MTVHNEAKKEDIAKIVIMPGDPLRAKMIAETYLKDYKLVNSIRGMYAYTGYYKEKQVTVMASGMGVPSMGIYSYELFKFYDVDYIFRVGSAGTISNLDLYSLFITNKVYTNSNYAKIMGDDINSIEADEELNMKFVNMAKKRNLKVYEGVNYTSDCFYTEYDLDYLKSIDCKTVEMEAFALLYNAYKLKKKAACILTISDNIITKEEISSLDRQNNLTNMIELVLNTIIEL